MTQTFEFVICPQSGNNQTSEYILVFLENAVSKKELKRKDLSQTANLNVI